MVIVGENFLYNFFYYISGKSFSLLFISQYAWVKNNCRLGWTEWNPTKTWKCWVSFLKRQVLQRREPPEVLSGGNLRSDNSGQRTGSPTYI